MSDVEELFKESQERLHHEIVKKTYTQCPEFCVEKAKQRERMWV